MKYYAFKNRLFFTYAAISSVLVAVLVFVLIRFTASQNYGVELLHQQEAYLSNYNEIQEFLERANRINIQINANTQILGTFVALDTPESHSDRGENHFTSNLLDAIQISSLLEGINGIEAFAERISIYNRYGDYVNTSKIYETDKQIQKTLQDFDKIDGIMNELQFLKGQQLIEGPHTDIWSENPNTQFITVYSLLSHTATSRPYGIIAIDINAKRLSNMKLWQEKDNNEYMIIDDRDPSAAKEVYPDKFSVPIHTLYPILTNQLKQAHAQGRELANFSGEFDGKNMIVMVSRPLMSNWLLVRALPEYKLLSPYRENYTFMATGGVIFLILLLFVLNHLAERISRPLNELSSNIANVGLQNLKLPQPKSRYSSQEIMTLDNAFREMLLRLDQAIALELQANLRVLQSQMNPHFLYNMLSIIIASCENQNDTRTASMCMKLTDMLRYSSNTTHEAITFKDEIIHTQNYLDLMGERYENLFTYEIDVSPEMFSMPLPRLTIQPLVENCFMHGLKNAPPWHIQISGRIKGKRWLLSVEDNGIGMKEEDIAIFMEQVMVYSNDITGNYQKLQLGGMGLINTILRLTLMLNEKIDYLIENRKEGGLIVEIGGPIPNPGSCR